MAPKAKSPRNASASQGARGTSSSKGRPKAKAVSSPRLTAEALARLDASTAQLAVNSTGSPRRTPMQAQVQEMFLNCDPTGDGVIDAGTLVELLKSIDPDAWDDKNAEMLIRSMEKNGDGKLHYKEFIDWSFSAGREGLDVNNENNLSANPPEEELDGELKVTLLKSFPTEIQEIFGRLPAEVQAKLLEGLVSDPASGVERLLDACTEGAKGIPMGRRGVVEQKTWHGLLGNDKDWAPPKMVSKSDAKARPGYDAYTSSEYVDVKSVLRAKAQLLAQMWRRSGNKTVIYSGAGLSTAAGVGDYASKANKDSIVSKGRSHTGSRFGLRPTFSHHALAAIDEKGLIGHWVQQNHDRLSQKAGFPQARLNEIHGAWGDGKNHVKMMDEELRPDLVEWLQAWAEQANMCVAIGTSLCGMNADRLVQMVSQRFAESSGEGLVVIGLQRTVYDDEASLRIWGLCDDVMKLVAKELGCKEVPNKKALKRGDDWEYTSGGLGTPIRTEKDPM